MTESAREYRERLTQLKEEGRLTPEAEELLTQVIDKLSETERSNLSLRRAALKAAGGPAMSSRLRDALYE